MFQNYPPQIAEALFAIAEEAPVLGKTGYNEHGKFTYPPIDLYYEQMRVLCLKHKLLIIPVERNQTIETFEGARGMTLVLTAEYSFRFLHRSGISFYDPDEIRRVKMHFTGAQSSGSAQSYVHKFALRGLFMLVTGEPDADMDDDIVERPAKKPSPPKAAKGKKADDVDLDDDPPAQRQRSSDADADTKLRPSKGPIITFFIEGKARPLRPSEVLAAVTPELEDLFPGDRPEWLRRNENALNELQNLNKATWQKVQALLKGPPPGGE